MQESINLRKRIDELQTRQNQLMMQLLQQTQNGLDDGMVTRKTSSTSNSYHPIEPVTKIGYQPMIPQNSQVTGVSVGTLVPNVTKPAPLRPSVVPQGQNLVSQTLGTAIPQNMTNEAPSLNALNLALNLLAQGQHLAAGQQNAQAHLSS